MCGIVGYIGGKNVVDVLLSGLSHLEYRGYDSAGIALNDGRALRVFRALGKLSNLSAIMADATGGDISQALAGIGHVRWATHGAPTVENAHPHTCNTGRIAIVHNGIIENFQELRTELTARGCVFRSQTDSEVIAHLISTALDDGAPDLRGAVCRATGRLRGTFAICVMCSDAPDEIIAVRKNAPLLVGLGTDGNFIASDIPALLEHTNRVIYLNDMEIAVVKKSLVEIFDMAGNIVPHKIQELSFAPAAAIRILC